MIEATDPAPKKKRKKPVSATQKTLAECKKRGWIAQVVEHRVPVVNILRDLFGVIDIVAITPDGILGIQACVGDSHANRVDKIHAEPRARAWIEAGGLLDVWSWTKRGAVGEQKRWAVRIERIAARNIARTAATIHEGAGA